MAWISCMILVQSPAEGFICWQMAIKMSSCTLASHFMV